MTNLRNRKVTLDTSVLIAWVLSKKERSLYRVVVRKAVTEDILMLTDIIWDECLDFADKKRGRKANITREDIDAKLRELSVDVVHIRPIPTDNELKAMGYSIRDDDDLKILYSADITNSVILVTKDDDFRGDVKGIKAKVMTSKSYLHENGDK
ncbi:MAG: type II toxin-antitoxin system VapC family toxin [Methanomassiliicoccaceae archaeon]|nr:type II toxin-antitoxin system VapC family toxin [Methanomassiliicoccaceae archaeon]